MVTMNIFEFCLSAFPLTILLLRKKSELSDTEISVNVMWLSCRDLVLDVFHIFSENLLPISA